MQLGTLRYDIVKTASGQVGYVECGDGNPLILILGYSGVLYHWNAKFIEKLASFFKIYMVDNRKVGLSDSSNSDDMKGLAQDIVDFILVKNIQKPLLFGWSMGGIITQEIALRYPDIPSGAVLFATIPQLNYVKYDFISMLSKSKSYSEDEYKMMLYGFFFSEKPRLSLREYITNHMLKFDNYPYKFKSEARDLQHKIVASWAGMTDNDLQQIKIPTLILKAKDDLVVDPSSVDFLLNNIKNAKLIVYPRGGHFLVHAAPHEIACDIYNYFTS